MAARSLPITHCSNHSDHENRYYDEYGDESDYVDDYVMRMDYDVPVKYWKSNWDGKRVTSKL